MSAQSGGTEVEENGPAGTAQPETIDEPACREAIALLWAISGGQESKTLLGWRLIQSSRGAEALGFSENDVVVSNFLLHMRETV